MHTFDTAIHLDRLPDGSFAGQTRTAYANMVGPFGGVTAACLLQAPMQHPQCVGEPVALTVNYAAALADGDFAIHTRVIRTNRSTQHWAMEMSQGSDIVASASAVFAVRKPTWSAPEAVPPPQPLPVTAIERSSPVTHLSWTHRYDMRFARGGLPLAFDEQQQADSESHVWVRDEPPRALDFVSLTALCDAFFPRVILRRRKIVPIGTVSLTIYFHADANALKAQGERHVLGGVRAGNFYNGYFDQSAEVWADDERLLASSHQMVYYKE